MDLRPANKIIWLLIIKTTFFTQWERIIGLFVDCIIIFCSRLTRWLHMVLFICWLHYYFLLQTHQMFMSLPGKLLMITVSWFWCLVTGFYPRDIKMNIRLDRINIESQISSDIIKYQISSNQMRMKPFRWEPVWSLTERLFTLPHHMQHVFYSHSKVLCINKYQI